MKPDPRFVKQPMSFWACVRSLSQELGYTVRNEQRIRVHSIAEMNNGFLKLGLSSLAIVNAKGDPTELAIRLHDYFEYRADVLDNVASQNLMTLARAKETFEHYAQIFRPNRPPPMNKQKGEKKAPAYFTGLINMLVEHSAKGALCDYDPRKLTTVTHDGIPLRTLARRVDGAFPDSVNPVTIWEIKEYYYTTTFGSRVAGGVYETLLDGLELEELRKNEGVDILHYLMIDDYNTWWNMGRSYLCRAIDMLNMGYVDEVLFGEEVVTALPRLVQEWISLADKRSKRGTADPPASL